MTIENGIALHIFTSLDLTFRSLKKYFLELLENILTNQSGIFELPPTGLKIPVHRALDI
jgi:hypothetical protein